MADFRDVENERREADAGRNAQRTAAGLLNLQARQVPAQATQNQSGYFDDVDGGYKTFFRLGVSRFGDGSVLK